jgi:CxxC motif-containing protein (DUF1111 family)
LDSLPLSEGDVHLAASFFTVRHLDGIPVLPLPEYGETANQIRTAPLWALRTRNRLMHDGLSFTKEEAIGRHRGQADEIRRQFNALSAEEKLQLMRFLDSL